MLMRTMAARCTLSRANEWSGDEQRPAENGHGHITRTKIKKKMWKRFLERHRLSWVVREPSITLLTSLRFPIDKRPS